MWFIWAFEKQKIKHHESNDELLSALGDFHHGIEICTYLHLAFAFFNRVENLTFENFINLLAEFLI